MESCYYQSFKGKQREVRRVLCRKFYIEKLLPGVSFNLLSPLPVPSRVFALGGIFSRVSF